MTSIRDVTPAQDLAGFFGPDSITWRIHADPSYSVGGLRALGPGGLGGRGGVGGGIVVAAAAGEQQCDRDESSPAAHPPMVGHATARAIMGP